MSIKLFLAQSCLLLLLISCKKSENTGADPVVNPLNVGLIAYYPFNGNAKDESGNGYDLTVNGPVLTNDRFGVSGKAYYFKGSSTYMSIPPMQKGASLSELAISVWIKPRGYVPNILMFTSTNAISECASYLGSYRKYSLDSYSFTAGIVTDVHCNTARIFDSLAHPFNEWTHVVLVQYSEKLNNGNTILRHALYDNGVKSLNSTIQESGGFTNPTTFNYGGTVGSYINGQSYFFYGDIDDIRIYDRKLSDDEVLQLYNLRY